MPSRHPTHTPGAGQETLMVYNKWRSMVIKSKHTFLLCPQASINIDVIIEHLPSNSVDMYFSAISASRCPGCRSIIVFKKTRRKQSSIENQV
jgi:hypothetical protein